MTSKELLMEVLTDVSCSMTKVEACGCDDIVRSYVGEPRGGGRVDNRSLIFYSPLARAQSCIPSGSLRLLQCVYQRG